MLPTDIRVGWVFRYAYLWSWQHAQGREEGDKDRPCLVLAVVVKETGGSQSVRVLPITHTPPTDAVCAIEIPAAVKLRLKLDDQPSWVVLTESNLFAWPGPDLRPTATETGYFGPLPPKLFDEIKRRFVDIARSRGKASQAHRSVPRSE